MLEHRGTTTVLAVAALLLVGCRANETSGLSAHTTVTAPSGTSSVFANPPPTPRAAAAPTLPATSTSTPDSATARPTTTHAPATTSSTTQSNTSRIVTVDVLSPVPLLTRIEPVVASSPDRLWVVGGVDDSDPLQPTALIDGVEVDLNTGTWSRVPDPPLTTLTRQGIWTGRYLVVIGVTEPNRTTRLAFLDPTVGVWESIDVPAGSEDYTGVSLAAVDDDVIVYGNPYRTTTALGYRVHLPEGEITPLHDSPLPWGFFPSLLVVDRTMLVAVAPTQGGWIGRLAAVNVDSGEWTPVIETPRPVAIISGPTGEALLVDRGDIAPGGTFPVQRATVSVVDVDGLELHPILTLPPADRSYWRYVAIEGGDLFEIQLPDDNSDDSVFVNLLASDAPTTNPVELPNSTATCVAARQLTCVSVENNELTVHRIGRRS